MAITIKTVDWDFIPGLRKAVEENLEFARRIEVDQLDAQGNPVTQTMKETEYLDVLVEIRLRREDIRP